MHCLRNVVAAAALCALSLPAAAQQQVPGAELGQVLITRDALEDYANRLEQTAASSNFSSTVRNSARTQASQVRTRLREGDFRVGDRIILDVQAETTLTRPFVVISGRQIALPGIGMLPMAGVLRSELTEHVRRFLSQYLRDPVVRAEAQIRIVMIDGVAKQGYLIAPVDIAFDSLLVLAGGLTPQAKIDEIRIERDGEEIHGGTELQRAITDGATLDVLSLQQGDRIIIPQKPIQQNPMQRLQIFTYLLTVPITIAALVALFK